MTGLWCFIFWFACLNDIPQPGIIFWTVVWILIYGGIKIYKESKRMVIADQQKEALRISQLPYSEWKKYQEEHGDPYWSSFATKNSDNKNNGEH